MTIKEQLIDYQDGATRCQGFFAYDEGRIGPLPAVLISHPWAGRTSGMEQRARELARLGYAAFALDMYGAGRTGNSMEENRALMQPVVSNRPLLAQRINAALTAVRAQPQIDARRVGAMGYCFGGLCVLDLARSGADVRGVVSFHGILKPNGMQSKPIKSKVLVLHGQDDPLAPVEDVIAFEKEMTDANVDWQLHAYGGVVHAFTEPTANDPAHGMVYNAAADRRSWRAMVNFFEEVLR